MDGFLYDYLNIIVMIYVVILKSDIMLHLRLFVGAFLVQFLLGSKVLYGL